MMKKPWMLVMIVGLLSLFSAAQTTSGSVSGNASVAPGQVGAGAKANQNTQAAGASANTNTSARSEVNTEHRTKQEPNSKARSGGGKTGSGADAEASGTSSVLANGTNLNAELAHSLDAKTAKPGDQVTAKVTEDVKSDGKIIVPKGSKLVGHVTEAQARGKESADSRLGIAFDKAVLKTGQELAFSGAVQAMAPPVNAALSAAGDESSMLSAPGPSAGGAGRRSSGGGLLGGTSSATGIVGGATGNVAGATSGAVKATSGLTGGLTAQGKLTSANQGTIGLKGLALNSATAGNTQGSVVSSTTRNVKLESGTQMLLKVTGSAQ